MRAILIALLLVATASVAAPAQCTLTAAVTQPTGSGSFRWDVVGAGAGAEIYNLVSFTPYSPTGTGPIFGLGLVGSEILLSQILSPLGAEPFHVQADATGGYAWAFTAAPTGLVIDADFVSIEWNSGYIGQSCVINATITL